MKKLRASLALLLLVAALGVTGGCRKPMRATDTAAPVSSAPAPRPADAGRQSQIGFASRQKLRDHFEKHGEEFGAITEAEYLARAQALRDEPLAQSDGAVLEAVRRDGVVTRYDRRTGAFLAFDPDRNIRTFFKPNDGERYFQRQRRR